MRRGTGAIGAGEVLEERGTQKTGTRVVVQQQRGRLRQTRESQTGLACGDTVGKI